MTVKDKDGVGLDNDDDVVVDGTRDARVVGSCADGCIFVGIIENGVPTLTKVSTDRVTKAVKP